MTLAASQTSSEGSMCEDEVVQVAGYEKWLNKGKGESKEKTKEEYKTEDKPAKKQECTGAREWGTGGA